MPRHNCNARGQFFEVRVKRPSGKTHGIETQANNNGHAGKRIGGGNILSVRKVQVDDIMRDVSRMKLLPPMIGVQVAQKQIVDTYSETQTLDSVIFGHQNKR